MTGSQLTDTPDALRPQVLEDFAGQKDVVAELGVIIGGARARGEQVTSHMLFAGPPGLGKTTLSHIVAHELDLPIVTTSGPSIDKPGALAAILVALDRPTLVFVDEIHRLPVVAHELLYSAMEDGRIDIVTSGEGLNAQAFTMDVEPFVLVGATTQAGALPRPFLDRFGYIGRLETYDEVTLTGILTRSAKVLNMSLQAEAAALIAARSRGTPRVGNQWLLRVRDYADVNQVDVIDADVAEQALAMFGVDRSGLNKLDRTLLSVLIDQFGGGPVGLGTLAAAVNEDPSTILASHEPYLMQTGLIQRTPRGRAATAGTFRALGRPVPAALAEPAALL